MLGRIIVIFAVVILLLGGVAGGFYFFAPKLPPVATDWVPASLRPTLKLSPKDDKAAKPEKPAAPEVPAFYDLPDVITEMEVPDKGNRLVRLAVSLKLRSLADVPAIQNALPKIKDSFQVYLRDIALGNLEQADQLEHFRQTMLGRLQQTAAPARIDDLLIREVQIQ